MPSWATFDPSTAGSIAVPHGVSNMVDGKWTTPSTHSNRVMEIIHPLDKNVPYPIFTTPDTAPDDLAPFIASLRRCPKSGLHNPLKNPERYLYLGQVCQNAGHVLSQPDALEYFAQIIKSCVPKSHAQALAEVKVTAQFLVNFGGDNVRRLAKSFGVPGDHYGVFVCVCALWSAVCMCVCVPTLQSYLVRVCSSLRQPLTLTASIYN
jgi:1-pyrroline-5-carboxylate dehydrogenase